MTHLWLEASLSHGQSDILSEACGVSEAGIADGTQGRLALRLGNEVTPTSPTVCGCDVAKTARPPVLAFPRAHVARLQVSSQRDRSPDFKIASELACD